MQRRSALIPLATACLAVLMMAIGGAAIAGYLAQFIDSAEVADRSALFWHLPLLLLGISLVALAVLLLLAAWAAHRGHAASRQLCRLALTVLPLLALVWVGVAWIRADGARKQRAEWQRRQAVVERLVVERQQIESFAVTAREEGLAWSVTTTGGRAGTYLLRLHAENTSAVLYRYTARVELGEAGRTLRHESPYTEFFARCFDGRDAEGLYVCVPNAGTSNRRFRLRAVLRPAGLDGEADRELAEHRAAIASTAVRQAVVDTHTERGRVQVQRIMIR